jgi:hypothetical protein
LTVGGDFPYDYPVISIWLNCFGKSLGDALLELLKDLKSARAAN